MSGKVYVVVPTTGQNLIVTDADNVVVLMTGHLIFRDGVTPMSGYAPGRWVEFVEVTNPALKARLRAQAEGGSGSARADHRRRRARLVPRAADQRHGAVVRGLLAPVGCAVWGVTPRGRGAAEAGDAAVSDLDTPRVQQVIISRQGLRGDGTPRDPVRRITQVFDLDGTLIAERDEWRDTAIDLGAKHLLGSPHAVDGCPFCGVEMPR